MANVGKNSTVLFAEKEINLSILKQMLFFKCILVVEIEIGIRNRMRRFSLNDIIRLPKNQHEGIYKDQVAVMSAQMFVSKNARELFAIDAFAIGYVTSGYSVSEFNNIPYRLDPGCVFILAPTHTCRMVECSSDYNVRMLLLDSNGHNLSVHLNYIVKSERWIQTYFNPILRLDDEEERVMKDCIERIVEQINRKNCPNQASFIRLATTWHHVELDNIMQKHMNLPADNITPLTRKQSLARQLYRLIINNYRKEHQSRFYSDQMCLTPQYLNQITKDVFGKTLSSLISDLLFSTARSMILSSEMSLQEIADELNFADQASFSKFIKKTTGVSPNALRKMNPIQ
jgi:AraC-like DNA-binding protein